MRRRLLIASTNRLTLDGLEDENGHPVSGATVSVTLADDSTGDPVPGQSWPVVMTPDGVGGYACTLSADLMLTERQYVTATIVADDGAGRVRTWYLELTAKIGTL